jgi:hypothetical protein
VPKRFTRAEVAAGLDTELRTDDGTVLTAELKEGQLVVGLGVQAGQPRLTNTFASDRESSFMKAGYGKTVRAPSSGMPPSISFCLAR